jgi:hypothetical protein
MQSLTDGEAHAFSPTHFRNAALAFRLRPRASFPEKLRQLVGKFPTKRALISAPFEFHKCRIRGKF